MKNKLLLPNKYKKIGWILLVFSIVVLIYLSNTEDSPKWLDANVFSFVNGGIGQPPSFFSVSSVNLAFTIIGVLFISGGLLVGFSKEKNEDEFIANLRLSSLVWAVLINYLLLLIAFIFIYDMAFLSVMVYNMFTVLLIFIIRFNYILYTTNKTAADEK